VTNEWEGAWGPRVSMGVDTGDPTREGEGNNYRRGTPRVGFMGRCGGWGLKRE